MVSRPGWLPSPDSIIAKFKTPKANTSVALLKNGALQKQREPLILQGWIHRKPKKFSKNLTFVQIRDTKGDLIQVLDRNSPSLFKSLKPDSTVKIRLTQSGSDIECKDVYVIGDANLIPGELQAEETKEWPAKYRYVQLRQPKFQQILRARAAIIRTCRSVLDAEGFTEIETPILFKSTPEGAREFLVPTRRKGFTYALPQSPQQYKQLLIASGIDKYYQVAKCFRDEDLRADRQPEFTQLDMEMAFSTTEDVQGVVEGVIKAAWKSCGRSLVTAPDENNKVSEEGFSKLTYAHCIANYGIDKPDLRSSRRVHRVSSACAVTNPDFPVFECLKVPSSVYSEIDPRQFPRIKFVTYDSEHQLKEEISKVASFSDADWSSIYTELVAATDVSQGDILAFGDRQELSYENPTPLGRLRQYLVNLELESGSLKEQQPSVAVWVEKFPSFEPLEIETTDDGYPVYDYKQLKATHHPFTMVDLNDYKYLEAGEPLKCHGMHFDVVIDGVEVGGGSQRIHDSNLQRYILQNVVGVKNPDELFGHLLEALATGCPPHAGLAIGLDRMIAMLLGQTSIRNVIAFPKTNAGTDPVVGSPSKVSPSQLAPYRLKVV